MLLQMGIVRHIAGLALFAGISCTALAQSTIETPAASPRKDGTVEYEALRYLHGLLDEDDSGYIDVAESVDFLHDELNVKGKSKDRVSRLHHDDPQISVDELWGTWRLSEVHNWTVDQVVEWLSAHVELPQYAVQFRQNNVDGSQMPRMASNSPEFITTVLSIRDPIHKRKISLKATDAVLFGAPKRDFLGQYKEWILLASIGIATCGVWLAYMQKKKYETRMRQVSADLENIQQLERQLSSLQEKVGKSSGGSEDSTEEADKRAYGDNNRLQEAEEELAILRDALQRAEQRVETRQWTPPIELEILLRKTYALEVENFKAKRAAAERQLHGARDECEKLYKKQQGVFGAFRIAHGSQLNTMDDGLVSARQALTELSNDITERSARWCRIEILTGLAIMGNNGKVRSPRATARHGASASYASSHMDLDHDAGLPGYPAPSYTSERRVPSVYDNEDSNSIRSYDSLPIDVPAIGRSHRRPHPDKPSKQQSFDAVAPILLSGRESSTPTQSIYDEGRKTSNMDGVLTNSSPMKAVPSIPDMKQSPSGVSLAASQISSEGGIDIIKVKKKRFPSMKKIFSKK
ncbi:hypothetical protein RvY_09160 [Ramazzottius varieornatus]|uniref:SAM domain-containing protein n=1 Tax=Ramazzottius varieornatus TaxID=947166 RepID=A0A1D1VCZ1_RAMVA|nr:hypothetical protein RvY_09160 [Ramazzottius varieornatus]